MNDLRCVINCRKRLLQAGCPWPYSGFRNQDLFRWEKGAEWISRRFARSAVRRNGNPLIVILSLTVSRSSTVEFIWMWTITVSSQFVRLQVSISLCSTRSRRHLTKRISIRHKKSFRSLASPSPTSRKRKITKKSHKKSPKEKRHEFIIHQAIDSKARQLKKFSSLGSVRLTRCNVLFFGTKQFFMQILCCFERRSRKPKSRRKLPSETFWWIQMTSGWVVSCFCFWTSRKWIIN